MTNKPCLPGNLPSRSLCLLLPLLPLLFGVIAAPEAISDDVPPPDMVLWLKTEGGVFAEPSSEHPGEEVVTQWYDFSPMQNWLQPLFAGTESSLLLRPSSLLGGRDPVVRLGGGSGFGFPNILGSATEAEYFALLKPDTGAVGAPFNLGQSWWEYSGDGFIYDDFGRSYDGVFLDPGQAGLTTGDTWRVYNVSAGPSGWVARMDGQIIGQAAGVPFQVESWNNNIGTHPDWTGELSELIVYDRVLSTTERAQVTAWLMAGLLTPPANVSCGSPGATAVNVNWQTIPDPGVTYEVERRAGNGAFVLILSPGAFTTGFLDMYLTPETTYTYRVRAVKNGVYSAYSAGVTITTTVLIPPAPPTGLNAVSTGPYDITLSWTDSVTPNVYYEIEYKIEGTDGQFHRMVTNGTIYLTTQWVIVSSYVSPGVETTYRMRAVSWDGAYSAYSDEVSVVTLPLVAMIWNTPQSPTEVQLVWIGSQGTGISYDIARRVVSGGGSGGWVDIASAISGQPTGNGRGWTDTTAQPATTYEYRIRATNSAGASDWRYNTNYPVTTPSAAEPPVALGQTLALFQDTPQAITLQSYSPEGGTLTCAIATQPAHGALTGTAPTLTYTPDTGYTGDDSFTFTASDGTATSAPATVSLVIYPPDADQTTSHLAITSPAEDTVILTQVAVQGFALDPDFARYELQYRPVAAAGATASAWTTITSDIRRIGVGSTAGALGTLNAGMMRNGLYELRVLLHTASGTPATRESPAVRVVIEGQRKIGPFSLSFKDLAEELAGFPLEIIRTYDTRDRDIDGDFGHGWRLNLNTVTLRKNIPLNTGWEQT
ncbi:MAG: cadherin-like domain-containing protein, partial [Opitutaceae bacterium]|nr:cadherin-like domain-containing protein [Opitutaceae bacterium]